MYQTIDAVLDAMYESISFEAGSRPDWSREEQIFAHGARMVRVTDDGVFEFDAKTYRADLEAMIERGELTSFWEAEIWRETQVFGEVAHVLSAYESRRSRNGEILGRGVNSIQLFKRGGRWWISAMLWRRGSAEVKILDWPARAEQLTRL